jgi:hypothetical protein
MSDRDHMPTPEEWRKLQAERTHDYALRRMGDYCPPHPWPSEIARRSQSPANTRPERYYTDADGGYNYFLDRKGNLMASPFSLYELLNDGFEFDQHIPVEEFDNPPLGVQERQKIMAALAGQVENTVITFPADPSGRAGSSEITGQNTHQAGKCHGNEKANGHDTGNDAGHSM